MSIFFFVKLAKLGTMVFMIIICKYLIFFYIRPSTDNEVFSYLLCGDYQHKIYNDDNSDVINLKHTLFRIPCVGNTWSPCTEWRTEWNCPTEVMILFFSAYSV